MRTEAAVTGLRNAVEAVDATIAELLRVCKGVAEQVDADHVRLEALERRIDLLERRIDRASGVHGA